MGPNRSFASVFRIVFAPAIETRDPKLAEKLKAKIVRLQALLLLHVPTLKAFDSRTLRNESKELIIAFQTAASVIGLRRPSLRALVQQ